jgi:hypothetical protein
MIWTLALDYSKSTVTCFQANTLCTKRIILSQQPTLNPMRGGAGSDSMYGTYHTTLSYHREAKGRGERGVFGGMPCAIFFLVYFYVEINVGSKRGHFSSS